MFLLAAGTWKHQEGVAILITGTGACWVAHMSLLDTCLHEHPKP